MYTVPLQVGEFVRGALNYADAIALAVGVLTPPQPPPRGTASEDTEDTEMGTPDYSLVHSVTRVAREAQAQRASLQKSAGSDRATNRGRCTDASTGLEAEEDEGAECEPSGVDSVEVDDGVEVKVIPVTPWGSFTPALNALLALAARDGVDLVLFQVSDEIFFVCFDVVVVPVYFPVRFAFRKCVGARTHEEIVMRLPETCRRNPAPRIEQK